MTEYALPALSVALIAITAIHFWSLRKHAAQVDTFMELMAARTLTEFATAKKILDKKQSKVPNEPHRNGTYTDVLAQE